MIKIKVKHIVLYTIGLILLIFGQPDFWKKIQEAKKENEAAKKRAEEAYVNSTTEFEIQELKYDSAANFWKNNYLYFQKVEVGNVNFRASKRSEKTNIETHDDENASESF